MNINEQLLQILTDICSVLRSAVTKELSTQEILNALKLHIFTLLELVSQSKNLEYDELEKAVQKAEAEIRFHIRLEQQMRLYADNLQEKIEQLEFEKQKQNEKKSQNQFQQREGSPNVIKKSYIRKRSSTKKQYVSSKQQQYYQQSSFKQKSERNQSQQSQEKLIDKRQSLLKSQNSYSYIKMYNIQKLIINKNQNNNTKQGIQINQQKAKLLME